MFTPVSGQRPVQVQASRSAGQTQEGQAPVDRFSPSQDESFLDVAKALPAAFRVPVDQTYDATRQFIKEHPFFHHGLMELPIGGGKHFRNVPFIGPGRVLAGALTLNGTEIAKGVETTRGTWDAE